MAVRVKLSRDQVAAVRRMWSSGASQSEMAVAIGVTVDTFRARLRDQLRRLPKRPRRVCSGRRGEDPTVEEIEAICLAWRSSWTENDRLAHL